MMRKHTLAIVIWLTLTGVLPATAQDAARIEAAAAARECLPAGTFTLERTAELRSNGRLCGNGHVEGQKTFVKAANGLYEAMIRTFPEDTNRTIDNLIFDGNKHNRPVERCVGYRDGGSTIIARGSGIHVHDVVIQNTLCGSAFEFGGSGLVLENNRIEDSGFSRAQKPGDFGPFADGVTLLTCNDSVIRRNYIKDSTDVAIVVGNAPTSCHITENVVFQVNNFAYGGLAVHHFDTPREQGSRLPGLTMTANIVIAKENKLHVGISVGVDTWDSPLWVEDAGEVIANVSEGSWAPMDIQDIRAGRVEHNILGRAQGQGDGDCSRFPPVVYTAYEIGNALVQPGYLERSTKDWCRP